MKAEQLIALLQQRLPAAHFKWTYEKEANTVRLDHEIVQQGMDIFIPEVLAKYAQKKDQAIDEIVHTIDETFKAMTVEKIEGFTGSEPIYPVIRSASFPKSAASGAHFIMKEHTAETRIYYALDLGQTYRLIDESMLAQIGQSAENIQEAAAFRVCSLPTLYKKDEVSGNYYYFINNNDGYDASRILNEKFLRQMKEQIEGDMTVSVPHQDVLIIGDIRNKTGYDVLAQMTMHFFTKGAVPVTSLSFVYEHGKLEPIFIMAKNRVAKKKGKKE